MKKIIATTLLDYLKENNETKLNCFPIKLTDDIKEEVKKFNTSEELLRSGGFSIETLNRAAFGFTSDDIKTLEPKDLKIKWKQDLDNVKYEVDNYMKKIGETSPSRAMKLWAEDIDLTEPIDVSYELNKFYIEDGHHRYYAAKILNKPLNVNLEIKMNPIKLLAPKLSYDDFHRCVFNQVMSETNVIKENKYNHTQDDFGNDVVYTKGDYKIIVNNLISPTHITLWYDNYKGWEKVGALTVHISERRFSFDKDFEKYYKVSEIEIKKEHRNKGFGKIMYDILIEMRGDNIKGLYSYLPDRVNKTQIPSIYKHYKTIIDNDNEIIIF